MTPQKHPLQWFLERVGKTVVETYNGASKLYKIDNAYSAKSACNEFQRIGFSYRDPHPLTASILTCNVLRCDTCGKIGTTEDLDKEVAAQGFEGEGWNRLSDGTVGCGCKK